MVATPGSVATRGEAKSNYAQHSRYVALLAFSYALIYGWLLSRSDLLPYVMDNNESFSSLWHAANLFKFGISESFGITDESFGHGPAAHPYVYTHQGNFPRLFAFLIYTLGARSIETQILITTFTVGVASIYMAFRYFSKITNPIFALLTCLVLITDYLLIAQWQVVTYRVWYGFFIFSTLLCIHAMETNERKWHALLMLNFCGLYYFEFVFATFVLIAAALYTLFLYRRTPRLFVKIWALQAAGAVIALGFLATQLILYLGWTDFLHDAYLTFIARNQFGDDPTLLAHLRDFFSSRNVVFWYNLQDGSRFQSFQHLIASLSFFEFQIHTPFFTILTWIPIVGFLIGSLPFHRPLTLRGPATALLLLAAIFFFSLAALSGDNFLGVPSHHQWFLPANLQHGILTATFASLGYLFAVNLTANGFSNFRFRIVPIVEAHSMLNRLSIFLLLVACLIGWNWALFNTKYQPLWDEIVRSGLPDPLPRVLLFCTVILSAVLAMLGPKTKPMLKGMHLLRPLSIFLSTALAAYTIVFFLSSGYIFSGYRFRIAPFTAFHTVVLISVAMYLLGSVAAHCMLRSGWVTSLRSRLPDPDRTSGAAPSDTRAQWFKTAQLATGLIGCATIVGIGYFWLSMQAAYLRLLPPDHYSFLKTLATPPFKGASFVSNTYAAPIAAVTGQWAYLHEGLSEKRLPDVDGALRMTFDPTYLWFADKRTNSEYQQPDYFICVVVQSLPSVLANIRHMRYGEPGYPGCSTHPLVAAAIQGKPVSPDIELVAIDKEGPYKVGFEKWAIVKFNW